MEPRDERGIVVVAEGHALTPSKRCAPGIGIIHGATLSQGAYADPGRAIRARSGHAAYLVRMGEDDVAIHIRHVQRSICAINRPMGELVVSQMIGLPDTVILQKRGFLNGLMVLDTVNQHPGGYGNPLIP